MQKIQLLPWALLIISGAVFFFGLATMATRNLRGRSLITYIFMAAGLQYMITLPVGVVQAVAIMGPLVVDDTPRSTLAPASAMAPVQRDASTSAVLTTSADKPTSVVRRLKDVPAGLRLPLAMIGAPFTMGGATVRGAFSLVHGPLQVPAGLYPSTAVAHVGTYLSLLLVQVIGVGLLFARFIKDTGDLRHKPVVALGIIVFLNAALNATWPWWGN